MNWRQSPHGDAGVSRLVTIVIDLRREDVTWKLSVMIRDRKGFLYYFTLNISFSIDLKRIKMLQIFFDHKSMISNSWCCHSKGSMTNS